MVVVMVVVVVMAAAVMVVEGCFYLYNYDENKC